MSSFRLDAVRVFSSMPGSANECAELTAGHMKWMIEFLEECGGKCTYQQIVDVGEEHHCDTVGALLKVLKNRCAIVISAGLHRHPSSPHSSHSFSLQESDQIQRTNGRLDVSR